MLDPTWPWTPLILWLLLAGLLALLIVRTALKDRREYRRFKRYRTTVKRQTMMRKWLIDSLWSIGGVAVVVLVLVWPCVPPFLTEVQSWLPFDSGLAWGFVAGAVAALTVLTIIGLVSARRSSEDVATIGDIQALLPRNRQELRLGALLSLNAGVSEELMFRLAIPALVYGATGSAIAAVVLPLLLFGALHLYQGVPGVVGSTIIGALFLLAYVSTGSILVPILLHALFDLRSLVLIPMTVYGAHRIDGRVQKFIPRPRPPKPSAPADGAGDSALGHGGPQSRESVALDPEQHGPGQEPIVGGLELEVEPEALEAGEHPLPAASERPADTGAKRGKQP